MFKRFIGLICLILICSCASAAVSVSMDTGAALLTAEGSAIVSPGTYDDIVFLGDGMFAAGTGGKYALMSGGGALLTDTAYSYLQRCGSAVLAEKGGKLGLLDKSGDEISSFIYERIAPGESGTYWALAGEADSAAGMDLYILDGMGGEELADLRLSDIGAAFCQGLLSVRTPDGLYGYIGADGKMALEAIYQYASDFISGCAVVSLDGKFGAIDLSGALVVPPEYDFLQATEFNCIIGAQTPGRVAVFGMDGALLDEYLGEDIAASVVGSHYTVTDDISMRVYSADHEMLFELPPSASLYAGIGEDLIVSDGLFGEKCTRIVGTQADYQNIYPLGILEGRAVYAYMDVFAAKYMNDMLGEIQYSVDMSAARYGVIDSSGEVLLESAYRSVELLPEDRLLVRTEDQWQLIDIRGEIYWSAAAKTEESISE